MSSSESKSSFAMGLSVAEVFLLLIFATFIYFGKLSESLGAPDRSLPVRIAEIMVRLEKLERQNEALVSQNDALKSEKKHLQDILKEMIDTMGLENSQDLVDRIAKGSESDKDGLIDDFKDRLIIITRLCGEDNTLINVSANNGKVDVVILANAVELFDYLKRELGISFKVGDSIDWENIAPFLKAVFRFEKKQNCRFFFNLQWTTYEDRVLGDQLKKYFIENKIRRVEHS